MPTPVPPKPNGTPFGASDPASLAIAEGLGASVGLAPTPVALADLAASCVRFVERAVGVRLDYTPETLPVLDHYLELARGAADEKFETQVVVAQAAGAYFGELVRRRHPSWWRLESDLSDARIELREMFVSFSPVRMMREALEPDEEPGEAFDLDEVDRETVADRLAELPEVPAREFLAPSTRLEVLDIVIEAVKSRQIAEDAPALELEPEDYER